MMVVKTLSSGSKFAVFHKLLENKDKHLKILVESPNWS